MGRIVNMARWGWDISIGRGKLALIVRAALAKLLIVAIVVLSTGKEASAQVVDCPPPLVPLSPEGGDGRADGTGHTYIFIDGSGSMSGYVAGQGRSSGGTYSDLILSLPDLVERTDDGALTYAMFGTQIREIDVRRFREAATNIDFYRTDINSYSRIDQVLARAADTPDFDLTVVITDLFLSGRDVDNSRSGPLRRPLARALELGKSIAIIGLLSPFKGKITDLPGGPDIAFTGYRPVYLILIARELRTITVYERIMRDLLRDMPRDRYHAVLFSRDMVDVVETLRWDDLKESASHDRDAVRTRDVIRQQPDLAQFVIDRDNLPRDVRPLVEFKLPLARLKDPLRLGYDHVEGSYRLRRYQARNAGCSDESWRDVSTGEPLGQLLIDEDNGVATVGLFPGGRAVRAFPRGSVFALDVELIAKMARKDGPALDWLRAWSFTARDEPALRAEFTPARPARTNVPSTPMPSRPFPTLNLWPLSELLSQIIAEQYQPEIVAQLRLVFRID